jgi:hypothetical protein
MAEQHEFTADEIKTLQNTARALCGVPIRDFLLTLLDTSAGSFPDDTLKELIGKLVKPADEKTGCMSLAIAGTKYTMVLTCAVVDPAHSFDIFAPSGWDRKRAETFYKSVLYRVDKIAEMADQTYRLMMAENPQLFTLLASTFPNFDFSKLKISENNRTLAFEVSQKKRIGITIVYRDQHGNLVTELRF